MNNKTHVDINDYTIIKLYVAIMTQMIIDAYKGTKDQRKCAIAFFKSKYFDDIISEFKDFNIKFSTLFNFPGSFEEIAKIIERGGAERLYTACRTIPLIEKGIEGKSLFVKKGKKLMPVSTHGAKQLVRTGNNSYLQIAVV